MSLPTVCPTCRANLQTMVLRIGDRILKKELVCLGTDCGWRMMLEEPSVRIHTHGPMLGEPLEKENIKK